MQDVHPLLHHIYDGDYIGLLLQVLANGNFEKTSGFHDCHSVENGEGGSWWRVLPEVHHFDGVQLKVVETASV